MMATPFPCTEGAPRMHSSWPHRCGRCGHLNHSHLDGVCDICVAAQLIIEALAEVASVVIPSEAIPPGSLLDRHSLGVRLYRNAESDHKDS